MKLTEKASITDGAADRTLVADLRSCQRIPSASIEILQKLGGTHGVADRPVYELSIFPF